MIIGNGDIASVIPDKEGVIFFASGVSNSLETRESEYFRECELLMKQDRSMKLVYFSTLSIFYKDSRYTRHKIHMEELIKTYFPNYTIMRLGNATWGKNPNHLINFFRRKIKNNDPIEVQDVYRYVLDKEEFLYWLSLVPAWNCEMNITGRRMKVIDIINEIRKGNI